MLGAPALFASFGGLSVPRLAKTQKRKNVKTPRAVPRAGRGRTRTGLALSAKRAPDRLSISQTVSKQSCQGRGPSNVATPTGSRVAGRDGVAPRVQKPSFAPQYRTRTIAITMTIGFIHRFNEGIGLKICYLYIY